MISAEMLVDAVNSTQGFFYNTQDLLLDWAAAAEHQCWVKVGDGFRNLVSYKAEDQRVRYKEGQLFVLRQVGDYTSDCNRVGAADNDSSQPFEFYRIVALRVDGKYQMHL